MSYEILKSMMKSIVRQNGNGEITGNRLQSVLENMIESLGKNSTFAGIATPDTDPGTPDGPVFYFANISGTYPNFSNITVNSTLAIIYNTTEGWVAEDIVSIDTNLFIFTDSLPTIGEENKIYFVPAEKIEEGNLFDEWIWNNGKWERLGSAKVDLTAYAKTEDVEAALGLKVDKVEGKELSSNDYTDKEKAKLAELQNYDDSEVKGLIAQKANDADLAEVAKTGKYEDLIGKPVVEIPNQPTGGESVWVNPNEDTEEVEVYSRQQTDALIKTRQKELTLTVKDNGNIVIGNIMGQTKEFMPATPSGDPMHWAYVAAGAEYNDTGVDIVKTAPWADMVDDEADKTVVHKAGYWYLNGLGDITNDQMRDIYDAPGISASSAFAGWNAEQDVSKNVIVPRTTRSIIVQTIYYLAYRLPMFTANAKIEVINFSKSKIENKLYVTNLMRAIYRATNLKHILDTCIMNKQEVTSAFAERAISLKTLKLYNINTSLNFKDSSLISLKSILYMIQNEVATSAITITLHADAYARAMASDEIVAALAEHPNVSLASA